MGGFLCLLLNSGEGGGRGFLQLKKNIDTFWDTGKKGLFGHSHVYS
jgi:hypothetical protein